MMEIISIKNEVPEHFYTIPEIVYKNLPFRPEDERNQINKILEFANKTADIILVTDRKNVRLLGICPREKTTASFGFWETTYDFGSCQKAFNILFEYLKTRGYIRIEGPVNFNTFHRYRLRFGTPSWTMFNREPVNPKYYPEFLKRIGFKIHQTYESRLLNTNVIPEVYQNKKELVNSVRDLPFEFIPLNPAIWAERETEIFELINRIFGLNPGFQHISNEEFRLIYNVDYAAQLCPHTSILLAQRDNGKGIAISLCHPNYKGLKLSEPPVFEKHYPLLKHRTLLAKTQGVHPDFRKQGLMNYLGAYGMLSFRKYYDDIIFCLMRADNFSLRFTDAFAYEKVAYATYFMDINQISIDCIQSP